MGGVQALPVPACAAGIDAAAVACEDCVAAAAPVPTCCCC